jgi:small subunit ribosomal protein S20
MPTDACPPMHDGAGPIAEPMIHVHSVGQRADAIEKIHTRICAAGVGRWPPKRRVARPPERPACAFRAFLPISACLTWAATADRNPPFRCRTLPGGPNPNRGRQNRNMANTASARKRIRQTIVRTARNSARKSRMRTFVKKVEVAIASGDKSVAAAALRAAQPEMQRASGKGVIHANTVARKLSRLSARIKALAGA